MTFAVTYRDKTGAKAEVEIEAESRAGCMAECKARGIAPMGIKEGRAQGARRQAAKGQATKNHDTQDHQDTQDRRRAIFLGVLGVLGVLALGTWWWLAGARDVRPHQDNAPTAAKNVTDVKDLKVSDDIKAPKAPKGPEAPKDIQVAQPTNVVAATNVTVAPKGPVYTNKVKAMGHIQAIGIDGKPVPRHKPIFRKPLERALATGLMPMRSAGGSVVANMRKFTDEQIIEMLKEPVTISKDDTPSVIEAKLNVQELKERVLRHVKEGGSVRDVFEEIDNLACGAAHERHLTRVGLEEAKRLGDPEVVRAWVAARNAELRALGMEEIRVPAKYMEQAENPSEEPSGDKSNGERK